MLTKDEVIDRLRETGVMAIFRVDARSDCFSAMDALGKGGLDIFEIATTTPDTVELIGEARKKFGDQALIGMGTVLDAVTAERGIAAGAQFVVSPSVHKDVLAVCNKSGIVSCPGAFSATEVAAAWKWGADLVKLFPISQVGPDYMKALMGPFPWIRFVPTGGIDARNAADYIRAGAFCLGVGGGLVSKKAIAAGRYDILTKAAEDILKAVKDARAERRDSPI